MRDEDYGIFYVCKNLKTVLRTCDVRNGCRDVYCFRGVVDGTAREGTEWKRRSNHVWVVEETRRTGSYLV